MSQMRSHRLEVRSRMIESAEEIERLLHDHESLDGWVCRASGIQWRRDGKQLHLAPAHGDGGGPVLSGEFVCSPDRSIHVRHTSAGWIVSELSERSCAENEEPDLTWDRTLVSTEDGLSLRYRCHWRRPDPDGSDPVRAFAPLAARFVGFADAEQED